MADENKESAASSSSKPKYECPKKSKSMWYGVIALNVLIVGIVLIIVVFTLVRKNSKPSALDDDMDGIALPVGPPDADGPYRNAVIAADSGNCSEIGRDMMKLRHGSAVDAAIAALFCIGLMNMHSAGIGGGGFMVVYNRSTRSTEVFDFREQAPAAAHKTMYINSSLSSIYGASAVAVPGEIKGYLAAWKKHGRLPWKLLVQPAIDIAYRGVPIGYHMRFGMKQNAPLIYDSPGLRELLVNEDGNLRTLGEVIRLPKLARTLERVRDDPESFYSGDLARDIVSDLNAGGGLITLEDMKNYVVKVREPLQGTLGEYRFYTTPPPGSGAVLNLILNILTGYKMTGGDRKDDSSSVLTYHRIVEAFKFAYAHRALLGDPDYTDIKAGMENITNKEFAEKLRLRIEDDRTYTEFTHYGNYFSGVKDAGTTHVSVLASNGDAVAATTTINLHFGSKHLGKITGVIFNNQMDGFSTPGKTNAYELEPAEPNWIVPGKRPLSSTAPSIFLDRNDDVKLVVGASGGPKITTATAQAIMNFLWFDRTLSQSVMDPRVHHQLMPMYIRMDKDYPMPQAVIEGLRRLGHRVVLTEGSAVVQAVARMEDAKLLGKSDPRKFGWAAGF